MAPCILALLQIYKQEFGSIRIGLILTPSLQSIKLINWFIMNKPQILAVWYPEKELLKTIKGYGS